MYEHESCSVSVSPIRDKLNRRIILVHSDGLPSSEYAGKPLGQYDPEAHDILSSLCGSDVLIYLHSGLASTTGTSAWGARAFRRAVDDLGLTDAQLPAECIALHVSFVSRAHASVAARFAGRYASQLYSNLIYCDLLSDLEKQLGVDSTILGLHDIDFDYDNVMRAWVGRQFDIEPGNNGRVGTVTDFDPDNSEPHYHGLDPSKPLLDVSAISLSTEDSIQAPPDQFEPRMLEEP